MQKIGIEWESQENILQLSVSACVSDVTIILHKLQWLNITQATLFKFFK